MNQATKTADHRFARAAWHGLRRMFKVVGIPYLIVLVLMMIFENALIFPAPRYPTGDWQPSFLIYEDIFFEAADGTRLHGWYIEHPDPKAVVMLCHGNGEHIAYRADWLHWFSRRYGVSIFAFDYRGYGRSEGSPHEAGILADGHAAQQRLADRAGIRMDEIVLYGSSIGGAVAIDLAANNGARGLIVENTFTSLPDVAARIYWWAPVRLLMRTRLNSEEKIRRYDGPLLQCHGTADRIVPIDLGKRLFDTAPTTNKRFVEMPGLGHNDPPSREFNDAIGEFLDSL